ncbi:MAG: N-acetylmuramoyl-L-alanine amidase [Christensenellaceae bacterium]
MTKGYRIGIIALALASVLVVASCLMAIGHVTVGEHDKLRVVLDAGHGGIDAGVLGKETLVKESDLNLAIVFLLKTQLENAGIAVTLTRKTEGGLYGSTEKYFKRRDMEKRREIILRTSPHLVVSVHQNFFPNRSKRGATVFYRMGDGDSGKLASAIQSEFNAHEGTNEDRVPLVGDYYMLNCSSVPSVIVECAFLSNAEDEALLVTVGYQKIVAERIARGVLSYLLTSA